MQSSPERVDNAIRHLRVQYFLRIIIFLLIYSFGVREEGFFMAVCGTPRQNVGFRGDISWNEQQCVHWASLTEGSGM